MAAHAGQKAQKTGLFHCGRCREAVYVRQGDEIPPCPNGHTEFKIRMQDARKRP